MSVSTVEAYVEDVTPLLAESWLGKNQSNRNVRDRVVDAYARDMKSGDWRLTGEAIKFGSGGRLLDGQHRLHAVVASGATVRMMVVRGLDEAVQTVIDSGACRTAGDALRMRGEREYSTLAAAARLAIQFEKGQIDAGMEKYTHTEILAFVDSHPDLTNAVDMARSYRHHIDVPPSVLTLAVWILYRVDASDCVLFFTRLADKTELHRGDAVLALLNRLTEVRRSSRIATRADYLSLVFRAWNYWRTRKTVHSLPIATRGGSGVDIPDPK